MFSPASPLIYVQPASPELPLHFIGCFPVAQSVQSDPVATRCPPALDSGQ